MSDLEELAQPSIFFVPACQPQSVSTDLRHQDGTGLTSPYPEEKILVEVQGGIYTRGAHSRGVGLERDYEKLNLAQLNGFRVFQFSRKND